MYPEVMVSSACGDQSLLFSSHLVGIFDDAVTGMAVLDCEGRFRQVNPALCRMIGRPAADLVGRRPTEVTFEKDRPVSSHTLHRLLSGAVRTDQARKRYIRPDGSVVWVERTVTALRDGSGAVVGLFSQVVDVTAAAEATAALQRSEHAFRALVDNSWDIITVHDSDWRYVYCSPAVTPMLGWLPEEVVGTAPTDHVHRDDREAIIDLLRRGSEARPGLTAEYRVRHKNGGWRWLQSIAYHRDDAELGGIVVTSRDITAGRRRAAQQSALAALSGQALAGDSLEELFQRAADTVAEVLSATNCAVIRCEAGGRAEVVRRHGPALLDRPYQPDAGEGDAEKVSFSLRAFREGRSLVWGQDSDGQGSEPDPLLGGAGLGSGAAAVIVDGSRPWGVVSVRTLTRGAFSADDVAFLEAAANVLGASIGRHRVQEELRSQASRDPLTGLPNRAALLPRLAEALAAKRRRGGHLAVVFLDLDDFKLINDSLGHAAGDRVVVEVGRRLQAVLRSDDTVARFGGDEFVIVCPDADQEAVTAVTSRLRRALSAPIELDGRPVVVTASLGIVYADDVCCDPEQVLASADIAMFAAKGAGKNRAATFDSGMRRELDDRIDATAGLRRAVERGELELHYQPIVRLATGETSSHEALLRWNHPAEGLVTPDRFVPHAEASGLILPIGGWVMKAAMAQSARWSAAGRTATVSLNVSPRQLTEADLLAAVEQALRDTGADPGHVVLEITESALMSDVGRVRSVMRDLQRTGVRIALDDFGSGYSSLSYLADLPFDFVKIDRSFVARFHQERRAAALLESIATLCHNLGLPAIVEGVETPGQLRQVRDLGIPYAQGYLFGRPSPAACHRARTPSGSGRDGGRGSAAVDGRQLQQRKRGTSGQE